MAILPARFFPYHATLAIDGSFHLLGGVGLAHIYYESENGIPFRFYFHDPLSGAGLTAVYILGYGVLRRTLLRKKA